MSQSKVSLKPRSVWPFVEMTLNAPQTWMTYSLFMTVNMISSGRIWPQDRSLPPPPPPPPKPVWIPVSTAPWLQVLLLQKRTTASRALRVWKNSNDWIPLGINKVCKKKKKQEWLLNKTTTTTTRLGSFLLHSSLWIHALTFLCWSRRAERRLIASLLLCRLRRSALWFRVHHHSNVGIDDQIQRFRPK